MEDGLDPEAVTMQTDDPTIDAAGTAGAGPATESDPGVALFDAGPDRAAGVAPTAAPLALYRRYRPDTFAEMIGQEHVTDPLQRALVNNRVNHAYLFSGPRGCGKTTSARILARALNCEEGPSPEPCGHCQSCQDLARGGPGSIDVIEIDAASHGGVDDARDLRERAFFSPVHSRYKVYIVDEAHMVTAAGFNALLKLVEEPPEHVKFIFATTEPDKVIGTIRSRTHHYPFRLVPPKVLGAYLATLCEAEGVRVEPAVLPLVVRAGGGSVRDSLSVLDQLLGGAAESGVSYAQATSLLGFTPDALLDEIVDAFAAGDAAGVFACIDKVIEVGQDPRRFAEDLLRRLRDLVIVAAVPDALASGLVDVAEDQGERLQSQAATLGSGELTRAAEVLAAGLSEMRGTTAPRLYLELMCARVLLPGTDVDERGVHARLDRLERRVGMTGAALAQAPTAAAAPPAGGHPAPPVATSVPVPPPSEPRTPLREPAARESAQSDAPPRDSAPREAGTPESGPPESGLAAAAAPSGQAAPVPSQPAADAPPPAAVGGPSPTGSASAPRLGTADVRRLWPEVLEEVRSRRRFTWILLSQNSHVLEVHDQVLVLAMTNTGARDSFSRGGSEDVLTDSLVQVLGADLRVEVVVDPAAGGSTSRADTPPGGPMRSPSAPAHRPQTSAPHSPSASASHPPTASAPARGGDGPSPTPATPAPATPTNASTTPGSAPPPWDTATPTPHHPGAAPSSGSPGSGSQGSGLQGSWIAHRADSRATPPGPASDPPDLRAAIRPLRNGSGSSSEPPADAGGVRAADDLSGARRDDLEVDDSVESHTDLLHSRLGAEMIAESDDDA